MQTKNLPLLVISFRTRTRKFPHVGDSRVKSVVWYTVTPSVMKGTAEFHRASQPAEKGTAELYSICTSASGSGCRLDIPYYSAADL